MKDKEGKANDSAENAWLRARKEAALFEITDSGGLVLTGKDTFKLLQGMLTNDVLKPGTGGGVYALMLNPKGRVLADMRVFKTSDEEAVLDLNPQAADAAEERLNKYKLSYKVEIRRPVRRALFHVCGNKSAVAVSRVTGASAGKMKPFDHLAAADIWTARTDRAGITGFDILVAPERADETVKRFEKEGVFRAGAEILEAIRIESGVPVFGKDMDETVIAPETGLEHAVSFEKGCYVGQEIVARAHWRGRVTRHLSRFLFEGAVPPPAGAQIVPDDGDRSIGRVTSAAVSPRLGSVAMGYIRREFSESGTRITTSDGHSGTVAGTASG